MAMGTLWIMLDSSGIGGIETHITSLAWALRGRGLNVEIVLIDDHGAHPLNKTWSDRGIPFRVIQGGLIGLAKSMRSERPCLVHTHGYKAGILGKTFCRLLRIPVVSTYHAGEPGTGLVRLYNKIDMLMSGICGSIAVSKPIAEPLNSSAEIIPNFVELPNIGMPTGKTIAFVGRLSQEKAPDRFVALAHTFPNFQFEIFGDGPMREDIERRATVSVQMHGVVPDMAPHWRNIGLLCIPSRFEGLPLVALEAMSHGVPVVAFAVGALPELIDNGENGFVVPAGEMSTMGGCISKWHKFSKRQQRHMSMLARKTIQDDYSAEIVVPRIIAIYDRAVRRTAVGADQNQGILENCALL